MDEIGLNYDFENLTPEVFREFLHELQDKGPYRWPNLYFIWEKPDQTLFMVGTNSTQQWQMIVRECDPKNWINQSNAEFGAPLVYHSVMYGISPNVGYYESGSKQYDPVEKLVSKVADFQYVGHWRDPDLMMDDPYGYNRVLACGRWALAMQKIGVTESLVDLRKLEDYLHNEMIMEFCSPEECLAYFNTHDGQKLETVDELKAFQGEYGFGIGSKWYHICYDEALDVVQKPLGEKLLAEKLMDAKERADKGDVGVRVEREKDLF